VQGIAGLDCWIAQSRLLSNLVGWIFQFFHFIRSPKNSKNENENFMVEIAPIKKEPSYFGPLFSEKWFAVNL
jgi:hypothetical protein